ncbi:LuxR C-terminal-related transcriptional regulator [Georgenia sp. Marseille-Q6866]
MAERGSYRSKLPRVPSIFCPTPATEQVVRHLPALVVLQAPRGFGKTSTVAYWLRSGALNDRSAGWLTIPPGTTAQELWVALHDSLVMTGVCDPVEAPDRASLDRALSRLTRRVVLVLDGLHNVEATDVDAELVDLAQAHDLLHLVVTARVARPITGLGPAVVDTAVLGIPELLLTVNETTLLASGLGLELAPREVAELVTDYAGWPALVRAALIHTRRAGDGRLVTDAAAAAGYLGLILADPENGSWFDVATALAVPDSLDPDDLPSILDRPEQHEAADTLLANSFAVLRGSGAPAYPAGIRRALLENLMTEDPRRYRELNERMSRRRREQGRPAEALHHALRAGVWPLVLAVLEENWAQLLRRHTDAVNAAVRALPQELVDSSPKLIVTRDYILEADTTRQAENALRTGLLVPGGTLPMRSLTTTQRLALRFDGTTTYGAAEVLLGRLDSTLGGADIPRRDPVIQGALPELLTQWGLSMLYDNDGVGAAYGFSAACQEALTAGDVPAAREAASATALALALLGHVGPAEEWRAYAEQLTAVPSALEVVAAPLTRSVIAGLQLERVTWPEVPRTGVEPGLVPLVELSRVAGAFLEVLTGRHDRVRVELRRHAADHVGDQEEVVRASLGALGVDLALAEGDIDGAGAMLAAADHGGAWTRAARARHAFYVGSYTEALRLTGDASSVAGARPRAGLELLLIHACAAWRLGQHERAVDHLATAVGIAADSRVLMPFLTVPRSDLEAIAPPETWSRRLLDEPPLAGMDTVFPEPLRAGQLSAAELRVLRELEHGASLARIGRSLYLSESTVKTHVRRIYRKLGVSDRAHALRRARELLLLE